MLSRLIMAMALAVGLTDQATGQIVVRRFQPNVGERLSFLTSTRLVEDNIRLDSAQSGDEASEAQSRCNCDSLIHAAAKVKPGTPVGSWRISFPLGPFVTDGQGVFLSGVFAGVNFRQGGVKIAISGSYSNLELYLPDGTGGESRQDIDSYRLRSKVVVPIRGGFNAVVDLKRTGSADGIDSNELILGASESIGNFEFTGNSKFSWDETAPGTNNFQLANIQGAGVAWQPTSVFELEVEVEKEEGESEEFAFTANHSLNFLNFHSTIKFAVKSSGTVEIGYTAILP